MIESIQKYLHDFRNNKIIIDMYIVGLLLLTFKTACNNSMLFDVSNFANYIYYLAFLLILPKVLLQEYNRKQLIFSALLILFNVVCVFASNTKNLILISLLLLGIKDTDTKKIIKCIFVLTMIIIVIHASVYIYCSILEGYSISQIFTFDREIHRGTVLFKSNNNYAMLTVCSMLQFIYITDRKNKKIEKIIILILFSFITYLLGQSKSSLIISMLLIIYYIFEDNLSILKKSKIINLCCIFISIVFSIFMLFVNVNSKMGSFLNKCLSGRIEIAQKFFKTVGLSIFPQIQKYDKLVTWHIDNVYISFLLKWGLLISIIMLFLIIYISINSGNISINDYYYSMILIWGIVENTPKLITVTIVPILLFSSYYSKEKNNEEKNILAR